MKSTLLIKTAICGGLALCLTACPSNPRRIPITNRGDQSKAGEQKAKANGGESALAKYVSDGDCLDLAGLAGDLDATVGRALTLSTNAVDVGTPVSTVSADIAPTKDEVLRGLTLKNAENMPVLLTAYSGTMKSFRSKDELLGLMAISSQDDCKTVTFADGTFNVAKANQVSGQRTIVMTKADEIRSYTFQNKGELQIIVTTPTNDKACADKTVEQYVERHYTLDLGTKLTGAVHVAQSYLTSLKAHVTNLPDLTEQKKDGAIDLEYGRYRFLQDFLSTATFSGLECK